MSIQYIENLDIVVFVGRLSPIDYPMKFKILEACFFEEIFQKNFLFSFDILGIDVGFLGSFLPKRVVLDNFLEVHPNRNYCSSSIHQPIS